MNGLIEQPVATGQVTSATPTEAQTSPKTPVLSPSYNKEEMDMFVANGIKIIHNPQVSDSLIARIVKSNNPIAAISDVTLNIVSRLEKGAEAAGKKLSLPTIAFGGNVLMGEIINSAEIAGLKKLDDKAKYQAFSTAIAKYLENALKTGKMTKEEIIQLSKEAQATPEGKKIAETATKINAGQAAPEAPGLGQPPVNTKEI